jgi:uncharacterized protein (DUF305 family)
MTNREMRVWWRRSWMLTPLVLMLPGCHQHSEPSNQRSKPEPGWTALTEATGSMHAAVSSVRSSGNSDVDFTKLMVPHHQAAIDMARAELLFGRDPQMRRLAQEIITDQQSEIELMQLWLKRRVVP